MVGPRTRVLVLFGGRSAEHEISCLSAKSVVDALDHERYLVTTVGITREGRWTLLDGVPEAAGDAALPSVSDDGDTVGLIRTRKGSRLFRLGEETAGEEIGPVDVCFPVLHGPHGEDGTIQGLLASYGVPYVGADVASSAVAIDKRQMKNVFRARDLPQVPYEVVRRADWEADAAPALDRIETALTYPLFTKPSRQGSSIGIHKATDRDELIAGVEAAYDYDRVAVVEQGIEGVRELECGVLGNARPEVTDPGEIVTGHEFYDFEAKYLDEVDLRCPADVPDDVRDSCREYARLAYLAVGARGMARVDFFYVDTTGQVFVNEINTIPGFTPVSMYPYLWDATGLSYPALVERLLELAFEASRTEARYAP
jgi:D-alanine-D-alanine ligase